MSVILLPIKNQKVFKASITPFECVRRIFAENQSVRCGVILLRVLHQGKRIEIQSFNMLKTAKV